MALSQGSKSSLPVILFLLIGFAAPLIAVVWFSFMPPRSFSFAGAPTLENYQTIFDGTNYISFLWSLVLAVITVTILALICYPVAFGLVRVFGKWSMLLTLLFTIPLFVSENIRLYGWVLFFIKNGVLLGTLKSLFGLQLESILFSLPAIIFGMVYVYFPFMLFPMTLGISMVPQETRDAAFDLGASRWQVFKEVDLPPHSHKAQWGTVIKGWLELTMDGKTHRYLPGESYSIPSGTVHSAKGPAGAIVFDLFEEPDRYALRG